MSQSCAICGAEARITKPTMLGNGPTGIWLCDPHFGEAFRAEMRDAVIDLKTIKPRVVKVTRVDD